MASVEAMVKVDDGTVVPKSMVMRWIPMTERLPEDGKIVLVTIKGRKFPARGYHDKDADYWIIETSDVAANRILAWMPLPPVYRPIEEDVW